ncbi:unnamed protein product [Candidula unifasciata]|uniref:Uncharacterized protein n=1 Tax=Candidula unifasciata TaxID=100452 RepID=A0A8S3Z675_9EUPU|nr:unnamed protein product [Candidula unifasciata]
MEPVTEAETGKLVWREHYGSTPRKHSYILKHDGALKKISAGYSSVSHFFRSVFLPQGYPDTVSEDYLSYQIWDTTQAFASSITGTLAAHAVLKGVGVGDASATVMGATLTWLLKDGAGMLGRILFAWSKGTGLDCDAKRWRLFADVLNDFAFFLDIMSPAFGSYFTLVVCASGICRSIVGVAGGATRAALTQHQARRNNMADVSAKDGSQTLVNLAEQICIFTSLHLFANYKAVTSVRMETLNQARLHLILTHYLETDQLLDVKTVNYLEPVLFPVRRPFSIRLGVSLGDLIKSISFSTLMDVYERRVEGYILALDMKRKNISIVLAQASDTLDQLQACFHAELINFIFDQTKRGKELRPKLQNLGQLIQKYHSSKTEDEEVIKSILLTSLHYTESFMNSITRELHAKGWVTEVALLGADEWRALWDFDELQNKKSN